MPSGYTDCACRDCFEIVVSDDTDTPDLCSDCEEHGCEPYRGPGRVSHGWECKRPDAYGERCAHCGEPGEMTGHQTCQYPQDM